MKNINKTANLLQAKAVLKKYATDIANILKSKGVILFKRKLINSYEYNRDNTSEEYNAAVAINVYHFKPDEEISLTTRVCIPYLYDNATPNGIIIEKIEKKICDKYPLANIRIEVEVSEKKLKIPALKSTNEVAKQIYLAMICYDKMKGSKITSMIKRAEERINRLIKKETGKMVESFFK